MSNEHSEDAVAGALRGLLNKAEEPEEVVEEAASDEAASEAIEAEQADEATEAVAEETTSQDTGDDDVSSLKARHEAAVKRYEDQLTAVRTRSAQSLESVNRQKMKFASERDRARRILEKALTEDGVDKAEAERLLADIRAGYNPSSANYTPQSDPVEVAAQEDQAITVNQWLNDNALTDDEANRFSKWLRNESNLTDGDRRIKDTYSLLSVVEPRWREAEKGSKPSDTIRAIKTVQSVQRRAAKAAAAGVGASKNNAGKRPSAKKGERLTDDQVSELFRASMEG